MNIEKAIIGRMLMDAHTIPAAERLVGPKDFSNKDYANIYKAMILLYESGRPVDLITIQDELKVMCLDPTIASLDNMKEIMNEVTEVTK